MYQPIDCINHQRHRLKRSIIFEVKNHKEKQ